MTLLLGGMVAVERRSRAHVRKIGLRCAGCGAPTIDDRGNLTLPGGACAACGVWVIDEKDRRAAASRAAAALRPTKAGFDARCGEFAEGTGRDTLVQLAVFAVTLTGLLAATDWIEVQLPPWAYGAAFLLFLVVNLGGGVLSALRWSARVRRLGLHCVDCGKCLVGGKHDELTRRSRETGTCGYCGSAIWREPEGQRRAAR